MESFWLPSCAAFTSSKVSMLLIDNPAISFLAVRLWNFALRSAMDPRSLRLGWSGAESGFRVDAEELLDMSDIFSSYIISWSR